MSEKRIGRQTPTTSLVLPYTETKGKEAVEIYNKTGRTAREWQELLIYDILAIDKEEMWVHSLFCYSIPRRNGKTEDVIMRTMWGIINGEKILYTAHMISTAHSVFETICALLDQAEIEYTSVKAKGSENIRLLNEKGKAYKLDHLVNFRTRSNTGGLGEGYDVLIIDEAQEYTIDQESALKYVISASSNPQTIMLGTPPTAISHGTVFQKTRDRVLEGKSKNTGWAEWSIEHMHDPYDRDVWYETNPSLGQGLTERVIENEITSDDVGIKYGVDGKHVAMSIATKVDEKIFVESIDCQSVRNGNTWIISFLKEADIEKVVIDGSGSQQILSDEIKDYGIKLKPVLPKVSDVVVANNMFEQAVTSSKNICHNDQPSLKQIVTNCKRRAIGTNGGFGFKAMMEEHEIALLDSVILAHWACATYKGVKKKQKISC